MGSLIAGSSVAVFDDINPDPPPPQALSRHASISGGKLFLVSDLTLESILDSLIISTGVLEGKPSSSFSQGTLMLKRL
jgi:hypothetical protein